MAGELLEERNGKPSMPEVVRQEALPAPISPTRQAAADKESVSALEKLVGCLIHFSLYGFNVVLFFACLLIVGGQVAAMSQIDFNSPELVVLGITILALWVLSILGLYGVFKSHRQLLRMYAFMLLVLILLQASIIVILYQNLDSSFMDEFAKLIKSLCVSPFDDETEFGAVHMNLTFDDSGSFDGFVNDTNHAVHSYLEELENSDMGMFESLCACTELPGPRPCIKAWVGLQFYKAFIVMISLFAFESVCAVLAWKYVDVINEETSVSLKKKHKRVFTGGVTGNGLSVLESGVGTIGDIGQKLPGAAAAGKLISPGVAVAGKLIAPGWAFASDRLAAGLSMGDDLQEKARHEAVLLTRTWYFEGTVLFASMIVFLVLATESYTTRPSPDMIVVLRMGELFVTLFLSVDVFIQVVVCMTPAERKRIPKSPWILMDFVVLAASWAYLFMKWRVFSIGRVLRVLRPLRTLRMFSEINLVLETIVDAMPLFLQAMLLITFLQMAYALICMSLWSGGLNYTCDSNYGAPIPPVAASLLIGGGALENLTSSSLSGSWASTDTLSDAENHVGDGNCCQHWQSNNVVKCAPAIRCKDQEDPDDFFAPTYCRSRAQPLFIRTEEYGFTGFDNFGQAMLTIFVQMTGDNGMQDIPWALTESGAVLHSLAWFLMMTAVLVLTLLALNLFLAVCCAIFDDVHEAVFERHKRVIDRDEAYATGFEPKDSNSTKEISGLIAQIATATRQALQRGKQESSQAAAKSKEALKTNATIHLDYHLQLAMRDFQADGAKLGWLRNVVKDIALSKKFHQLLNVGVLVNTLVLMVHHHGISDLWLKRCLIVETCCLIFFWLEFFTKIVGFGWSKYIESSTHRLDLFVLLATSAGYIASMLSVLSQILSVDAPGSSVLTDSLSSLSSIRLVRLLRVLQMSRWVYSSVEMRALIETVYKSWKSIVLIGIFSLFSLVMFAVLSMHLLGGSLGLDATIGDYPRRNVENFSEAFNVAFLYLTGGSWSGVMYWYMEHAELPLWGTAFYMVSQFIWMRLVLFSLFVAVLLINFNVPEEDKMPRQRLLYEREENAKIAAGLIDDREAAQLRRALAENLEDGDEIKKTLTTLQILKHAIDEHPTEYKEGLYGERVSGTYMAGVQDLTRVSLMLFDIAHPFRLWCAKVESNPLFDKSVMYLVLASCVVIAFETPELMAKYGVWFNMFNLTILLLFWAEAGIRIVTHGLLFQSGPTPPYIVDAKNRLDIFVILVVTGSYFYTSEGALGTMFRILRVMAPLLELGRNDQLAKLVATFIRAMPAVAAILGLLGILITGFGLVAVEYFGGRLYRCVYTSDIYEEVPHDEVWNETMCDARPDATWKNPPWDFDNILSAGITIFYLCINASWEDIMESVLDITDVGLPPKQNSSAIFFTYFVVFHVVFSFFMLNLFIGVLSAAFSAQSGSNLVTMLQRRWIRVRSLLNSFNPTKAANDRPKPGVKFWRLRQKCWDIAEDSRVDNVWTATILANVTLLMLDHYPADDSWVIFADTVNYCCLLLFTAEVFIKCLAYSLLGFLSSGWGRMDMFVVMGSWGAKVFGVKAGVGALRAFRTVRLVLLVKRMPSLMALMNTVLNCIGPAFSIAVISFIFFYVFAIIGMKVFGTAPTDVMPNYNEQNSFTDFVTSVKLLFQLVNGQDLKVIIYELVELGYNRLFVFLFFATFFFVQVFICMNLFIVTVLDNFANLCSMDDVTLTPDDTLGFAQAWHQLTYEAIWNVDPEEVGVAIDEESLANMTEKEVEKLFKDINERETDIRLTKWCDFKRSFPLPPWAKREEAIFSGWMHRPNTLAKITQGLVRLDDLRYFWINASAGKKNTVGHLTLNWYHNGATERELDYLYSRNELVINRVQVRKVLSDLPPLKTARQVTVHEKVMAMGMTTEDGKINKLAAALSGRPWLVSLANAQRNHPENPMANAFNLAYFEEALSQPGMCIELNDDASTDTPKEIAARLEEQEQATRTLLVRGLSSSLEGILELKTRFEQFGDVDAVSVRIRKCGRTGADISNLSLSDRSWALVSFSDGNGASKALHSDQLKREGMVCSVLDHARASESTGAMSGILMEHRAKMKGEGLTFMQQRFRKVIEMGVAIVDSETGCFCNLPEDYKAFWPFFSRVLTQVHELDPSYAAPWPEGMEESFAQKRESVVEMMKTEGAMLSKLNRANANGTSASVDLMPASGDLEEGKGNTHVAKVLSHQDRLKQKHQGHGHTWAVDDEACECDDCGEMVHIWCTACEACKNCDDNGRGHQCGAHSANPLSMSDRVRGGDTSELKLRTELESLKLPELNKRAIESGVDPQAVDDCNNAPDARNALIKLVLDMEVELNFLNDDLELGPEPEPEPELRPRVVIHSTDPVNWDAAVVCSKGHPTFEAIPNGLKSMLPTDGDIDIAREGFGPCQLRVAVHRNLVGWNMPARLTQTEREQLEELVETAIKRIMAKPEWRGRYASLTPGHPDEIDVSEYEQLVDDGIMFKSQDTNREMKAGGLADDWPHGRGCYISADERTTIWVGTEDHIIVNAGSKSETDVELLLDRLRVTLELLNETHGIAFRHDAEHCGYITSSPKRAGTGMVASAILALPKLTLDGTANRVHQIIESEGLQVKVLPAGDRISRVWGKGQLSSVGGLAGEVTSTLGVPGSPKKLKQLLGGPDEVGDGDTVEIEVRRTYGVIEAEVACSLFLAVLGLRRAERDEVVVGAVLGTGTIGLHCQKFVARMIRRANQTQQLALAASNAAIEQARLVEEQAQLAAAEAQAALVESQKKAMKAAQAAKEEAIKAARDAKEIAKSPSEAGTEKSSSPLRFLGKLSPADSLDLDLSDFEMPNLDVPDFLKVEDAWAIELDVHPTQAPGLTEKSSIGLGFLGGKSKKMKKGIIPLMDIEDVDTSEEIMEINGIEKFAFTIRTKQTGFREMTWLANSFEDQEEWVVAIASHLKSASSVNGDESPDGKSPSGTSFDKKGWLDLSIAGKQGDWAEKHVSVSTLGFIWDDGESESQDELRTASDIRLKLVAECAEAHGAWIVALKWLEGGCKGRAPRDDPHMYPGGIPPRPLNGFEMTRIQTNYGMLDLPFRKLSRLIHLLQEKRTLEVTQAYSREYLLYATFCCEMYAYRTAASDLQQRLSGIEHAIEACDGLNFRQTMETLCLMHYGKNNSLDYRKQTECYQRESEFVAVRLIQAACSAMVCLKLVEKGKGPRHWFWKKHKEIYKIAIVRARDQRIRTLACLMKLVRRQRPVAQLVEYMQKAKDTEQKHRDFMKEREVIKERKRFDGLSKAAKRRELARTQQEKRLAAEEAVEQETVQNPIAGSSPLFIDDPTDEETMKTPQKSPRGLSVQIPGEEDHVESDVAEGAPTYESKKQHDKRKKKEAKQQAKQVKKREKAQKKLRKKNKQTPADEASPAVATRPFEVEDGGSNGALGDNSDAKALALVSGDTSEQLAELESLGALDIGDEV